ncbi:uncharacterized protein M421DRAFT_419778 [Didymella exigua CBS 183.55]|uniref:Bromo domain-containing protein n=1 Tax=Didymella exigua CBS 183.55 TaxID=1150837 RepID=A0A6A5RVB6_9PLEO|nr:uncharacterized protein M421DRAFT_419778 [Didymella exigua CBS 183.55]KAF1929257.1 hypothetical protein M421DRAFT_419778 [Didymella exigua CBS 183.55]
MACTQLLCAATTTFHHHPRSTPSLSPRSRDASICPQPCDARLPLVSPHSPYLAALAPIPPQQVRPPRAADLPRGMTVSVSAYTTLESLLIFQSLKSYGVTPSAFSKTSELLKANPEVTAHKFFQAGRLSPDALRSFYLERLRREIELEQSGDGDAQSSENPRKRKATGPTLPTVQESLKYEYLMPKLLEKLYWTWRTAIVNQVRADEDTLDRLQREITGIERGEWDEQLRERVNTKASSRSPSMTKKSPRVAHSPLPQAVAQNGARRPDGAQQTPQQGQAAAGVLKTSPRKKKDQRPVASASQPIAASPGPHPIQTPPPHFQQPPPPNAACNGPPYPHISPFPPAQQPLQPSPQQGHARPHAQSPAPGPPGQYQQPIQPYGPNGAPQYAAPGGPQQFPPNQRFPQQGPHSPSVHTSQQKNNYFPHPAPPAHPPPPQAGFMLPPFQVSPQNPTHVHHPPASTPYPQVSTPTIKRPAPQQHHQTPGSHRPGAPPMHPGVIQARQSFSTPLSNRSHSATSTPQSAKSRWKQQQPGTPGGLPGTPRPVPEAIDDYVPPSATKQSPAKPKFGRKSRGRGKAKDKDVDEKALPDTETQPETLLPTSSLEVPASDSGTRQGRSRRKAPAKRGRPGSVASSRAGGSVRDRSRSRSILSHTDTIADTDSQTGHRIKTERRGSLDDGLDEEVTNSPSQMTTRRRAAAPTTAPSSTRRKRNARQASLAESEDTPGTPSPNRTIIAYRNFHRTCQVILDDITSHKHGSMFATAVKTRGYHDIIKRPTDLSTIKKALANGAKYVNAMALDTPVGSPGSAGATIELPASSDVVPPKAIVNPAQLEKELMRMFVNAMMFNPGEEGVVTDAREMFESVQRSVSNWRNVHGRGSGREQGEGTPAEEEEGGSSKRRKV